jgi:hypothetical protein
MDEASRRSAGAMWTQRLAGVVRLMNGASGIGKGRRGESAADEAGEVAALALQGDAGDNQAT